MQFIPLAVERGLLRLGRRPRRIAAALCLLAAAVTLLTSHRPGTARTPGSAESTADSTPVLVAAHDLSPGTRLTPSDVRLVRWPSALVPSTSLDSAGSALGHPLGAAMARGEPLTRSRLLDTGIAAGLRPGQVAVTAELGGHSQAAILAPGALIDLYASTADQADAYQPEAAGPATRHASAAANTAGLLVASGARVLAVLRSDGDAEATSVVLATDTSTASRIASHAASRLLATLRPPS